jgi:superfamily II DNA/RNA helicase
MNNDTKTKDSTYPNNGTGSINKELGTKSVHGADSPVIDTEYQAYSTFDDMNLKENLLRGIYAYGYERPSLIQQRAIVPICSGRDTIAQAQSGMGKTATFCIAALQTINEKDDNTQCIIISPTRELSQQTRSVLCSLAQYMDVRVHTFIGGTSIKEDLEQLSKGVQIAIGTPGRLLDMSKRRQLRLNRVKLLIIDEADEMLSKGFREQIYDVFQLLPSSTQVVLISATMPDDMFDLASRFMRNPNRILVKREQLTLEGIKQFYVYLERDNFKFDTLCDLYENLSITQCIIYCNSKRRVDELVKRLTEADHTVSAIHGETTFEERERIMMNFRKGNSRVLISTDLLARGIDVQQVSLVINYDLPFNIESYLHRIGRTGRFGRKGSAINFVCERDVETLRAIEKHYATEIKELPMDLANV